MADYLSPEHRDHPAEGCPSSALIEEIARGGTEVRDVYTRGIVDFVDVIAGFLDDTGHDPTRRRTQVLAAFAGMVATMQMARTVTDPALSDALLTQGVDNALLTLGVDAPAAALHHADPEAAPSPTRDEHR